MTNFADFRTRLESWWDARIVEGERAKSPYVGFEELTERLDGLASEAPEREWVVRILIDWLESADTLRWLPAISVLRQEHAAAAVPALRAAAESTNGDRQRSIDTFRQAADEIERAVGAEGLAAPPRASASDVPDDDVDAFFAGTSAWSAAAPPHPLSEQVPDRFREQFEAWHDRLVAEGRRTRDPAAADEAVADRLETLPEDSAEREWIFRVLIDWLFSPDPWRWHAALETLSEYRVQEAIPSLGKAVNPPNTDEKARWASTFEEVVEWIENGPPLRDA